MAEAYIFDAVRTPRGIGKEKGSLYTVRPTDLLVTVAKALRDQGQANIFGILVAVADQAGVTVFQH